MFGGRADLPVIEAMLERKGDRDAGVLSLERYLQRDPQDAAAWYLLGRVFAARDHHALTALAMAQAARLDPGNPDILWELVKVHGELMLPERALGLAEQLCELAPDDHRGPLGQAVIYERLGRYEDAARAAERALALDPENRHAAATLGFCCLHRRDYARGWPLYHAGLGHIAHRDKRTYVGEPEWDGTPGRHIAVYSEQGLGDQIAGLEPLRDVGCTVTALSVDPKLRAWFARCYPEIGYHGSDIAARAVDPDDPLRIDASINLFGLHLYRRISESDYPKTPYLTAHPRKSAMWRAALDRLGTRPKVGLAWSGGTRLTYAGERTRPLAAWMDALGALDVDVISLEYKNRDAETAESGYHVQVWPDAIRSPDYEDTAALISQLDYVVGPPTTVIHAAGALGVPALCLVNAHPNHHYGACGERMPYYGSVRLVRTDIEDVCQHLSECSWATTSEKTRRTA